MMSASWPRSREYWPMVQPEYGAMYCIAADSEADAATTIVYAMAPCSSSLRTTLAMVEAFWPMATYTQNKSLPFWLMMVSTATAVLPVCRSPMISSRWPRPIGTIASIALRPVCTGCDTDWRAITPGATFSMTSVSLALIGPLPSIGWPRELTTRPRSSGPIGTDRILPVVLTMSPSLMCWYSPRTTAPTESRSRLSARPKVFLGNSIISPCITSDRPWMRQMPSVTETTVPWVRMRAPASRFWMRLLISSEISEGLSCIRMLLSFQRGLERAELRSRRAVDDLVAEHDLHPGNEIFINVDFGSHLASGLLLQPLHQIG